MLITTGTTIVFPFLLSFHSPSTLFPSFPFSLSFNRQVEHREITQQSVNDYAYPCLLSLRRCFPKIIILE